MIYQPLGAEDAARAIEWLIRADPRGHWTGFTVDLGAESAWLLHAMYELPGFPDLTVDDLTQRSDFPDGEVGDMLAEITGTNVPSELVGSPGPEWRRLAWADVVTVPFSDQPYAPSFRWLNNVRAAGVQGPPEGSMDLDTLATVAEALARQSPDQQLYAYYAGHAEWAVRHTSTTLSDEPIVFSVDPDKILDLAFETSPSNIWPADHSWCVSTDADLSATFVSGPAELIARLEASPDLELIRWSPSRDE